jgi:hypothetical protein
LRLGYHALILCYLYKTRLEQANNYMREVYMYVVKVKWSASCSGRFTLRCPLYRRLDEPQSRSVRGDDENVPRLYRDSNPPFIEPVALCYTTELSRLLYTSMYVYVYIYAIKIYNFYLKYLSMWYRLMKIEGSSFVCSKPVVLNLCETAAR